MKRIFLYISLIFLISLNIQAKNFTKKATNNPILVQNGKEKHWCPICGMSIKKFYKTSYVSKLKNGKKRQYCSIRCLAVDMKEYNLNTSAIAVVDVKTEKLINAKDAFYVVGSKVSGTMSKVSKLAFKNKKDAKEFKIRHKGKIVNFYQALKMAQESLKSDIAMTNKKRQKKMYPMGKKIFTKICNQKINLTNFLAINELKSAIKNKKLCKPLKEKQLQAVALYLWEVKRFGDLDNIKNKIIVKKDEKCPVCGMFTYKYPRWVAQIFYKHNNHIHRHSFDGVKDLMKFYFNPMIWGEYKNSLKKDITKILVTDYYSQEAIDGTKAFYVLRSDIYGPMGHELIPFINESDAKIFKEDHRGEKIIQFKDIVEQEVYKLDMDK